MSYCTHSTFWDTSEFVSYSLHIFGCVAFPIHLFGAYCILFKTPTTMKSVKCHLLNLHFWSCFLDLSLSVLATPYLLFPSLSGYPLGLFKEVGLGTSEHVLYVMVSIGVLIVAMVQVFEVRFLIFIDASHWWRKIRITWFIINYLIAIVYIVPIYYLIPDQVEGKKYVFNIFFSCVPKYIDYDRVFVFVTDAASPMRFIGVMFLFFAIQVLLFAVLTGKLLRQQIKKRLSKNTINLQVKFQRALILQILIPVLLLLPPAVYLGISNGFTIHIQYMNNISIIIATSHGFFSTIVLIAVQAPYREFLLKLIGFEIRFRSATPVQPVKISNFVT